MAYEDIGRYNPGMNWLKPACGVLTAWLLALPGATVFAQERPDPSTIRIYDAAELTLDRYTVAKRIWAGTWHASLWVPTYRDQAAAIDAIKSQAADAGADGVVNLHCLNDAFWSDELLCYALAIKLKPPVIGSTSTPR